MDDRSEKNLIHVDPRLVHLCYMMYEAGHRFIIPDPPRSQIVQNALHAQGRKPLAEVNILRKIAGMSPITAKANKGKVTWTTRSKHFIQADGFAKAIDFCPLPVNYENTTAFEKMGPEFEKCAKALGIKILWGGRGLGKSKVLDLPHLELLEE